jgi:hypothetical protein
LALTALTIENFSGRRFLFAIKRFSCRLPPPIFASPGPRLWNPRPSMEYFLYFRR